MKKNLLILDLDDGPGGGGGAALARLLVREEIEHSCWNPSTLSSGWTAGSQVSCRSEEELKKLIVKDRGRTTIVPGTWSALEVLDRIVDLESTEMPRQLRAIVENPRGLDSLIIAKKNGLNVTDHYVVTTSVDRTTCQSMTQGGWLLHDDGEIEEVEDDGEAWFRINGRRRRRKGACALIPSQRRFLFLGAHWVENGTIVQSTFLRADSIRPSWRPALARSVGGRMWERLVEEMEDFEFVDGFLQTAWLHCPGTRKIDFLASTPLPSVVIGLDGHRWASALRGGKETGLTPADLYYADAPIDLAVHVSTLLERIVS